MTVAKRPAEKWVPVDSLVPWVHNPRVNDAAAVKIKAAIERFGFLDPVIAQAGTSRIIAGHTRVKAAKMLGMASIPVIFLPVSDAEADTLTVLHNRSAEDSEWDALKLIDLYEGGLDLVDAGFSETELAELLDGDTGRDEEPLRKKRTSEPGTRPAVRRMSVVLYLFTDDADELEGHLEAVALPGETRAGTINRALHALRGSHEKAN